MCDARVSDLRVIFPTGRTSKFPVSGDTTFSAHFIRQMVFPEMSGNRKCASTVQIPIVFPSDVLKNAQNLLQGICTVLYTSEI